MPNLNGVVDRYLNSKYGKVEKVADNLEKILLVADNLQLNQGIQGEAGVTPQKDTDYFDGRKGNGIVFAFRNAPAAPVTPGGGSFDGTTSVPPTNWTNDPTTPPDGSFTWIVMTTYLAEDDAGTWNNNGWSASARLTGSAGTTPTKGQDYFDGNDGSFQSFIYRNASTRPSDPIDGSFDGVVETIPVGWTDDPTSPNTGDVTWMCKARYVHNGASWNKVGWSAPAQFSGTEAVSPVKGIDYFDGANGVFVSFIYTLAAITPASPTGGSFDGTPQNEVVPTGWADDPSAPSTGVFIWISTRKYEKVGQNWVGTDWDTPTKFSGEDGYTPVKGLDYLDAAAGRFTSYIFRNAVLLPATPTGGTFNGVLQQETAPTGWDDDPSAPATNEINWMSKSIYQHDPADNTWTQNGWSIPVEFSGSVGLAGAGGFNLFAVVGTSVAPNSIEATADGAYAAKAVGIEYFNNEWVFSFTTNTTANTLIGVRPDNGDGTSSVPISVVAYGIIRSAANVISVIEGGSDRGSFGTANNTDVFAISNIRGTVYYYKNGTLFYTSLVPVSVAQSLIVFLSADGDTVDNITIVSGYAGRDGAGSSTLRMSVTDQMFKYDGTDALVTPVSAQVTFLVNRQGITGTTTWTVTPTASNGGVAAANGTDSLTLTEAQFIAGGTDSVVVTASATAADGTAYTDTIRVIKVTDGYSPVKGVDFTDASLGEFKSYRFHSGVTAPTLPASSTSYNGTAESGTMNGWADDPFAPAAGEFLWVTTKTYASSIDGAGVAAWNTNTHAWSAAVQYSYIPSIGVDYFDGAAGAEGNSVFISYVFRNLVLGGLITAPNTGSMDNTTDVETVPSGWTDNPVSPPSDQVTWVSKCTYVKTAGVWSARSFSTPAKFTATHQLQGYLTNSAHTAVANNAGVISSFANAGGTMQVFLGSTLANVGCTFAVSSVTAGLNISVTSEGVYTMSTSNDATDVSVATITATHTATGQSVALVYTLSKSKTGADGVGTNGAAGPRGSSRFYRVIPNTVWTDAVADAAITDAGFTKVVWDVVTLYNNTSTPKFSMTRYWDGTVWVIFAEVIDGNLLVDGTILARHIRTGILTADMVNTAEFRVGAVFGDMQSTTFDDTNVDLAARLGWQLRENGDAVFQNIDVKNGTFRGVLDAAIVKGPANVMDNLSRVTAPAVVQQDSNWDSPNGTAIGTVNSQREILQYHFPSRIGAIPNQSIVNASTGLLWVRVWVRVISGTGTPVPWFSLQNADYSWTTPDMDFGERLNVTSSIGGSHSYFTYQGFINVFGGVDPLLTNIDSFIAFRIQLSSILTFGGNVTYATIRLNSHYRNL